jgi:hypothetical protein
LTGNGCEKKNDLSLNTRREQGAMRKNRAVDFGHDTLTTFDLNEAQFKAQMRIFIFFFSTKIIYAYLFINSSLVNPKN